MDAVSVMAGAGFLAIVPLIIGLGFIVLTVFVVVRFFSFTSNASNMLYHIIQRLDEIKEQQLSRGAAKPAPKPGQRPPA